MDRYALPLAIIIADEPAERDFADRILSSSGWKTIMIAGSENVLAGIDYAPDLILIADDNSSPADENLAEAIRRKGGATSRVPIVNWSAARAGFSGQTHTSFDEILGRPCTAEQLLRTSGRWRPEALPAAFVRLKDAFGEAAALDLLDRFRQLLIEVHGALATDRARDLAHRVAGMAGMLGFTALGQKWLALSEGENTDLDQLRRATRRAILTIDRELPEPSV